MRPILKIDTNFDFRSDTPKNQDPDSQSPRLRLYHKVLWSKALPSGIIFTLSDETKGAYLYHKSKEGEFYLASDTAVPALTGSAPVSRFLKSIPSKEMNEFYRMGYTIGGMMLFPGFQIDRTQTINQAKGFNPRIKDRLDLTLECIRRFYSGENHPLKDVLFRYRKFFQIFGDFRNYAQFFLLQDALSDDFTRVKFFHTFENFETSPVPQTLLEYLKYKKLAINFIKARNRRISKLRFQGG